MHFKVVRQRESISSLFDSHIVLMVGLRFIQGINPVSQLLYFHWKLTRGAKPCPFRKSFPFLRIEQIFESEGMITLEFLGALQRLFLDIHCYGIVGLD